MSSKLFTILMTLVLCVTTGCAGQTLPAVPAVPAEAGKTAEPTMTAASVPTLAATEATRLTILAAASLTESFTELGSLFETQNPGVRVEISFAGSQQLAQQLDHGADADVFASASLKHMKAVIESGRVMENDAKVFVQNRLVVITPKGNPGGIFKLPDLAKPGLKLDLADPSVPVGQYTVDFLDKAVKSDEFGTDFKDKVLANVVSYEDNVKSVVTKISLGEADAGVVYVTDITRDAGEKIDRLEIPDELNTVASYPIAPVANSQHNDLARAFVELVLSPTGQAVMEKYGFLPRNSEN